MVVPGLTTSIDERVLTVAMVLGAVTNANRKLCTWSAITDTPSVVEGTKPDFETAIVYVSGASESSQNRPDESVVTVAVCDGLVAETLAPAIGAPPRAATTVPLMAPVVPAMASAQSTDNAAERTKAVIERPRMVCRSLRRTPPLRNVRLAAI